MDQFDYYSDRKFCTACDCYVPYLMSVDRSYCAQCGKPVRLFSQQDWATFNEKMAERKENKGGRPRRDKKESA